MRTKSSAFFQTRLEMCEKLIFSDPQACHSSIVSNEAWFVLQ